MITRLGPHEAFAAAADGALIVDIRDAAARARVGVVTGSLNIPRTVLEWRLDPESPSRNPHVGGLDRQIIVLCDHGYSSSLAAAVLVELGFRRAADVIGGIEAWLAAGLPVTSPRSHPAPGELLGMGPPETR